MPETAAHSVAIVGAGIGGAHMDGYLALPDRFRVAAICDLDRGRAQALADRAPGTRVETDLQTLLNDPAIDIVDVCLPPSLHAEVTLQALAAGKHAICEKPLAASLEEVDGLIAAAEAAKRLVVPVFQYRYGHGVLQLRHLIEAGLTGCAYSATLETHWDRDAAYYAVPWRGTWVGELGGAVVSHAIHAHDLLCHVLGPVARVGAFLASRVNHIETEDSAAIALEMESGALATSSVTLGAAENMSRLRFCFANLTAESGLDPYHPGGAGWRFTARLPSDQATLDAALATVAPEPERFAGFFAALDRRLCGAETDGVTAADGRRSIELATAIYAAARSGRTVALPLAKDDPYHRGWRPGPPSPGGKEG